MGDACEATVQSGAEAGRRDLRRPSEEAIRDGSARNRGFGYDEDQPGDVSCVVLLRFHEGDRRSHRALRGLVIALALCWPLHVSAQAPDSEGVPERSPAIEAGSEGQTDSGDAAAERF